MSILMYGMDRPCRTNRVDGMRFRDYRPREADDNASPADGGFTVVEIIMTIAIMALVMVPVLNAVIVNIQTSARNGTLAIVETTVQNAADRVNRVQKLACNYTNYVVAAVQSQGEEWKAPGLGTATVEEWKPGSTSDVQGSWVASTCHTGDVLSQDLVQRVTISVSSPDKRVSRTIQVVKSRA